MGYVCPLGIAQLLKSWNQENTTSLISYTTLIFAWYYLFVCFVFITGNCQKTSFTEILWLELGFRVRVRMSSKGT